MIYVISTFTKNSLDEYGFPDYGAIRSVGYYKNYSDAAEVIKTNQCDIFESLYTYAVIETLPEGLYPSSSADYAVEFYAWNFIQNRYERVDQDLFVKPGFSFTFSLG